MFQLRKFNMLVYYADVDRVVYCICSTSLSFEFDIWC